jgi:hypothetical protein
MSNYKAPGITVHQVLTETYSTYAPSQNVTVLGGHASLTTYTPNGSRKAESFFGAYINGLNNTYGWKRNETSGVVDEAFTRVFLENALLRYATVTDGVIPANSFNELRFGTSVLASNKNGTASAVFGNRGVRVGDVVHVTYAPAGGGNPEELWTRIAALKSVASDNTVTAVPVSVDSGNLATRTASASVAADNAVTTANITPTVTLSNYTAPSAGLFEEKYTLTAVKGSIGGDISTAEFTLLSESGLDDYQSVIFTAWDTPLALNGISISLGHTSNEDVAIGASWTITAKEAYTAPTFVVNGSYRGSEDASYIITVKRGGTLTQVPVLFITTTVGGDTVKEVKVAIQGTPLPLGNKGLTITLSAGTQLHQGDVFVYTAAAAHQGPIQVITLADNVVTNSAQQATTVSFHIVKNLELNEFSETGTGVKNWTTSQDSFALASNIMLPDPTWTADEALPLIKADVYAATRVWQRELNTILSVSSIAQLDTYISGDLVPANELKYAVYKALQNSGSKAVLFTAVENPEDLQSWSTALTRLERNRNVYDIVPLTFDTAIQNLVATHVASMSTDKSAKERMGWFCRPVPEVLPLYVYNPASDKPQSLCTIVDNPNTEGVRFNYLTATNQPGFLTAGVRFGDIVRTGFYTDDTGKEIYSEYTVDTVINSTTLVLREALDRAVTIGQRFEVWRPITLNNYLEAIAELNVFNNRRIVTSWPELLYADGATVPGYFAAAAAAALACASLPQQAITQAVLQGFTGIPDFNTYSDDNLDNLTLSGNLVLAETEDGDVIIRHAVTTGNFDNINEREEMSTRCFDSATKHFRAGLSGIINKVNAIESGLDVIEDRLVKTGDALKLLGYTPGLGGHIVDYTLISLGIDPLFEDNAVAHMDLVLAHNLNHLDVYLQI